MRRPTRGDLLSGALAVLMVLGAVRSARATPIVDQAFEPTVVNSAALAFVNLAQTFTVGIGGTLDAVEVDLLVAASSPLNVTASVLRTTGGVPTFDALASVVVPVSVASGIRRVSPHIDLSAFVIAVAPGDLLAIYLTVPSGSPFINWLGGRDGDATYAGGMAWAFNSGASGAWQSEPLVDLGFRTFVTVPEPTTALLVLGGLAALVAARR